MNGNFKVRCIKSYSNFTTVGKIYNVVNGVFTYDGGHDQEKHRYSSVEEMNNGFISQFELIVHEVNRPAKVGEWIKIVNAGTTCGKYKNGDIFQVTYDRTKWAENAVLIDDEKGKMPYINFDEYVILENYQPEVKPEIKPEVFHKAKVGDKIKLVKLECHSPSVKIGEVLTVREVFGKLVGTANNAFYDRHEEYIIVEDKPEEVKPASLLTDKELIDELVKRLEAAE